MKLYKILNFVLYFIIWLGLNCLLSMITGWKVDSNLNVFISGLAAALAFGWVMDFKGVFKDDCTKCK